MDGKVTAPDPERARLAESMFDWRPIDDIVEAVVEASSLGQLIYVERAHDLWRWSFAHTGGPYPLLRIAALFLKVDYHQLVVSARSIAKDISVLGDPDEPPSQAWAVLELARGSDRDGVINALARPKRRSRGWRSGGFTS